MGRQEGGAHCRVLNIGFRLINWAENGAWERPPIQQQAFRNEFDAELSTQKLEN